MLALAIGCKGCDAPSDSPAATAQPEPEGASLDQLKQRLASLSIDLSKSYPARADGVVDCGEDKTCFLVMLERCAGALLEEKLNEPAGLLIKKVHARYRIEGKKGDACALQRLVIQADAELPEQARKSLEDKGRDELQINLMLGEAKLLLRSHMPEKVTCLFSRNRAFELGLDMVEKKPLEEHFSDSCEPIEAGESWPQDLALPSPAAGAQRDAAASATTK